MNYIMKNKKGFSLIELMVAITILALIMPALGKIMQQTVKTWFLSTSYVISQKEVRNTMDYIRKELRQAGTKGDGFPIKGGVESCASPDGQCGWIQFVKHGEDLELQSGVSMSTGYDKICIKQCPAVGEYGSPDYEPGYIAYARDASPNGTNCNDPCPSGGSSSAYQKLTSRGFDVESLKFKFCAPTTEDWDLECKEAVYAAGDSWGTEENESTHLSESDCILNVQVTITGKRVGTKFAAPPTVKMASSVQIRNYYIRGMYSDSDKDGCKDIPETMGICGED